MCVLVFKPVRVTLCKAALHRATAPTTAAATAAATAGKTLLARAVANRTDACFIRVIGSELVQKYVGEGARMVSCLWAAWAAWAWSVGWRWMAAAAACMCVLAGKSCLSRVSC